MLLDFLRNKKFSRRFFNVLLVLVIAGAVLKWKAASFYRVFDTIASVALYIFFCVIGLYALVCIIRKIISTAREDVPFKWADAVVYIFDIVAVLLCQWGFFAFFSFDKPSELFRSLMSLFE